MPQAVMLSPVTDVPLPRYLQLLWGVEPSGRRGPRPSLTIEAIADVAVRLADEGGLEAVSMKAVADELGMTTMSLYRYVDAKDDLYAVMLDRAYGSPPARLAARGGWRTRLDAWARAITAQLLAHPWVVTVPMTSPPMTPQVLSWTDRGLLALSPTRLTEQEKLSSLLVVDGFVRQHVTQSLTLGLAGPRARDGGGSGSSGGSGSGGSSGSGDAEAAEPSWPAPVVGLIGADRFPYLVAATPQLLDDEGDFFTEELDFGLRVVLDGIAALVARRG